MRHTLLFAFLGVCVGCGGASDESTAMVAQACATAPQEIVTQDHNITLPNGARLHVVEKFSLAALHGKRRAILMLPATLVTHLIWNANVPGRPEFNGLERAAEEGYFAYTIDYEGYGTSSRPADGKSVDFDRVVEDTGHLVRWIRTRRGVSKVDLIGSSFGSSVAVALGSTESPIPRRWIGHIVLTALVYKNVTPMMSQFFLTPELEAMLLGVPGGYIDTAAPQYGLVLAAADPVVQGWCFDSCPGNYAVGPTLAGFDLPAIEASRGRAPVLQFWGNQDMITPLSDAQQFQAEYGGERTLVVLDGGAHVPQWESVRDQFWSNTFAFLDDDHDHGGHHGD